MRVDFTHIDELCVEEIILQSSYNDLIGIRYSLVSFESNSNLNFIGFGNRNISAFGIDKHSHQLSVEKTWSFFSDKIKILFELGDNVYLLNSEKYFCVTNSKNQSVVRVLSNLLFDQAVMISDTKSNSIYLLGQCESNLIVLEVSNNKVIDERHINCGPIQSPINIRGKFCIFSTYEHTLILSLSKSGVSPYEIFKIKEKFGTVDVLDRDDDNSALRVVGYRIHESDGQICIFNTSDETIQKCIPFKDSSLNQSKVEFGRYLCFSSNYNLQNRVLIF